MLEPCPAGTLFSQPPDLIGAPGSLSVISRAEVGIGYEVFSGVTEPIGRVTWWGYEAAETGGVWQACNVSGMYMVSIAVHEGGGIPGVYLGGASAVATREDTGSTYPLPGLNATVYRYSLDIDPPVVASEGVIAISSLSSSIACEYYWLSSPVGDGAARYLPTGTGFDDITADLSVCLGPAAEGEGEGEGEGGTPTSHTADQNGDGKISLSELLRVIQFYNSDNYGCEGGTEDGYAPNDPDQGCTPHASDYNPQDWDIALTELLRSIQFYNLGAYHPCPEGEDGFCAGT